MGVPDETGSKKVLFEAGQVVLKSRPFVAVLDRKWKFQRCDYCFDVFASVRNPKTGSRPLTCPDCAACLYCNATCRASAKPDHEDECQYLRQKGKSLISDTGRFMMKLLLKLSKAESLKCTDKAQAQALLSENIPKLKIQRHFDQLLSHYHELIKDKDRIENIAAIYNELEKYDLKELPSDSETFIRLCGRVLINSFNYTDELNQRIGTALYLAASVLDHSCAPNATFSFSRGHIVIRCLEDVLSSPSSSTTGLSDEAVSNLRISYLDLMDSTENRKRKLKRQYYFDCACTRCTDPALEYALHSIRCQSPQCSGRPVYVGIAKRVSELVPGQCEHCGWKPTTKMLEQYISVCSQVQKALSAASSNVDDVMAVMTGLIHPDHHLYTKAAKRAFEAHMSQKNWSVAREYGLLCLNSYRKYKSHVWPAYGQLLFKLGRLELQELPDLPRPIAKTHLEEAVQVIGVTHGREHALYKQVQQLYQKATQIQQQF